eukprot:3101465-Pyramimonas_sp.AAC.1
MFCHVVEDDDVRDSVGNAVAGMGDARSRDFLTFSLKEVPVLVQLPLIRQSLHTVWYGPSRPSVLLRSENSGRSERACKL